MPIQSHISENKSEVAWVHELHPGETSYSGVDILSSHSCNKSIVGI